MKLLTGLFFIPIALSLTSNISTRMLVLERDHYPIEDHTVHTSDGYILNLFRMNRPNLSNKNVVFLMHGLFGSSDDYVVNGVGRSLAHILLDEEFDVWLGNARGNKYSKSHEYLSNIDPRFWSFEWHEIAMKDLPAMINYILRTTGSEKLSYIGHSQGGTTLLVLNSLDPEYGMKTIKSAHLLAPACFVGNARTDLRTLAPILGSSNFLGSSFGAEVLAESPLLDLICTGRSYELLCANLLNFFGGFDYEMVNKSLIDDILSTIPSGASWKQVQHYFQETASNKFQQFDYGLIGNLAIYRSTHPPEYHLENIAIPVVFYVGDKDDLVTIEDSQKCFDHMNSDHYKDMKIIENMDHMNFAYAWEAKSMVYDEVLKDIRKFL
ncbi:LIPA.2 family protein [Megaselia abdita]